MKISKEKIQKIKENILAVLYSRSPQAVFTADVASEIARDEEFVKKMMLEMEKDKLVFAVKKNNQGLAYIRRIRWRLSNKIFEAYDKISKQNIQYDEKNHTYF
jgi:hypothetical protein